jgi:hypothetical protein
MKSRNSRQLAETLFASFIPHKSGHELSAARVADGRRACHRQFHPQPMCGLWSRLLRTLVARLAVIPWTLVAHTNI